MAQPCRERILQILTLGQVEALEPVLPHLQLLAVHCAWQLSAVSLIWTYTGLAWVTERQTDFADALRWKLQSLVECERQLGPEHQSTATVLNNLASLLQATIILAETEPSMRRALERLMRPAMAKNIQTKSLV